MTLPTCCQYHADRLPDGCRQGRECPERTRRIQEAEQRHQTIGYEAALPAAFTADATRPDDALVPGWLLAVVFVAMCALFSAALI